MSPSEHTAFWLMYGAVIVTTTIVALTLAFQRPPRHCRYLVQVINTPGVYACSEHPKPKARP